MKVALVHDYLNEFGGAERVLEVLSEIYPDAPIYTAFVNKNSSAYKRFKGKKIITSWAQNVPFFASFLHSPLRFLAPLIWGSFDFSNFDVVLASSSWFITRGFGKRVKDKEELKSERVREFVEISYCHTPPRYLYGYATSVEWQKYWPLRVYAAIVNHYMRVYDYEAAQKVDYFIANSKEVAGRIKKFYRRDSTVIYPPVDVNKFKVPRPRQAKRGGQSSKFKITENNYFLVVSRLVASKKVDIAVEVCAKLGLPLKVVGVGKEKANLEKLAMSNVKFQMSKVEFLGEVSDEELIGLYQGARAVIFPAEQEDFGLVPVEAMAAGVPVIVNAQGGVLETVIDWPAGKGKCTGVYFDPATSGSLTLAINNFLVFEKKGYFDCGFIQLHAQKFSKGRFKKEIKAFVNKSIK
ncbi:glycosyltransferase [Candidatus Curtissbacteria bacterium]|nr:glycosyltransferase [Candidatus Curtissbacteria bacterium]